MKRSHEPLFWALFGAGGMLSALVGPVLVLLTGVLVPLGVLLPGDAMAYERMRGFALHPAGALAILAVIALFLFHACHRMLHSLHDLGAHPGRLGAVLFYGFAALGSLAAALLLVLLQAG